LGALYVLKNNKEEKMKSDSLLSKIYYDLNHPAGFSTVDKLWKATNKRIPKRNVLEWLQSQDAYTLHKPARKHFERNRYHVDNIDDLWQADLNDMQSLKKYNDGYNYILTIIDVFSKYAWMRALRNKSGAEVTRAFKSVFTESGRKAFHLQTDKGKEFLNKTFQDFLKAEGVKYYHSNNPDTKCAVVERLNRTLKTRMWRYFTSKSTYRYIDKLPALINAYNSSHHRTIGMEPKQVNRTNVLQVWRYAYAGSSQGGHKAPKFSIGDTVRITRERKMFLKGYESMWSEEIFKIISVIKRRPTVYTLAAIDDEPIEGTFYEHELQRVRVGASTLYKIDKILEVKGRGARRVVKVKWTGYPDSFNSWISASEVQSLV
jgi:Integrase core domain